MKLVMIMGLLFTSLLARADEVLIACSQDIAEFDALIQQGSEYQEVAKSEEAKKEPKQEKEKTEGPKEPTGPVKLALH